MSWYNAVVGPKRPIGKWRTWLIRCPVEAEPRRNLGRQLQCRGMSRPFGLGARPSSTKLYPAQSLFLPAIFHADVIFVIASVARMILQASLLILAA